jgi:integrase/recombinase XerD
VGEIAHLKIGDLVLEDGSIADQVHLNPSYTKGHVGRVIFVSAKLSREIAKYMQGLSALPARLRESHAPFIQSQKGGAFSANSLCQLLGNLYAAAGIRDASSHSGRRGFITKLAHAGVSSKVIMELAGHKHLTTTQRYIDVTDDHKRAAVDLVS